MVSRLKTGFRNSERKNGAVTIYRTVNGKLAEMRYVVITFFPNQPAERTMYASIRAAKHKFDKENGKVHLYDNRDRCCLEKKS